MKSSAEQKLRKKIIQQPKNDRALKCLSCGGDLERPRRRYCSDKCRQQINWVLSLSKGLLKTLNARRAAFSFTQEHVILDVLPGWSKRISRFMYQRSSGNKPADDLKCLILRSGTEWHRMVENNNSKSYATQSLAKKCHRNDLDPDSIRPDMKAHPKLSKDESQCLKLLRLTKGDLACDGNLVRIKTAYKRMAKVYHPDMGGDAEKFKKLNEAHKRMILWAENPMFTSRKALPGCWSYDGNTNRWSPPL